jgi:hypothetical protein
MLLAFHILLIIIPQKRDAILHSTNRLQVTCTYYNHNPGHRRKHQSKPPSNSIVVQPIYYINFSSPNPPKTIHHPLKTLLTSTLHQHPIILFLNNTLRIFLQYLRTLLFHPRKNFRCLIWLIDSCWIIGG